MPCLGVWTAKRRKLKEGRSPRGDTVLPRSSLLPSWSAGREDAAGAPPLHLHSHSFCSPGVLSAQSTSPHCPPHSLPAWDPLLVPSQLERSFAGPVPRLTCWSFLRGPWEPSNREPEAEGGQDPALIRVLRAQGCQATFVSHANDLIIQTSSQTSQTQSENRR